MKSDNKIYCFFIALSLLFWNPISYFLMYANTPDLSVATNHLLYWIYSLIFIIGILFIYLLYKNKFHEKIKNIILIIVFTGILFPTIVIIDKLIGLTSLNDETHIQKKEGLIFEADSKASYNTLEFNYTANINSLGLRDREVTIKKGDRYRILCFGDSWTFGWGVDVENSWPKKLEQYLLAHGFENTEVINCGQGGQFTSKYRESMKKVVPMLKPDLVLVGVLQGDDLAQLYITNFMSNLLNVNSSPTFSGKLKIAFISYLKYSFKNTLSLFNNKKSKSVEVKSNWETSSMSAIENFTHWQKIRFNVLDDSVQYLFKSGNLNPALLNHYINFPERLAIFNNPYHPATQFSIQEMNKDFIRMKEICDKYNSHLVFINLPLNNFTGHIVIRSPNDVLDSYFKTNNKIDSIYQSIAQEINISYIELTKHFIDLQNKSGYFYKYDGHPNERGYDEIAKYISSQLIDRNILDK